MSFGVREHDSLGTEGGFGGGSTGLKVIKEDEEVHDGGGGGKRRGSGGKDGGGVGRKSQVARAGQ